MKDALSIRMKSQYENRTRYFLPRRTYSIIRLDGKAFHTYTRELEKPFDEGLIDDMNETAKYLCGNIQGAKLAYVQSDEISILLTDFDKITTQAWFDGNIQKIVSVSSSLCTSKFNQLRNFRFVKNSESFFCDSGDYAKKQLYHFLPYVKQANFDSRIFTIPDREEVINYFIWRQQDCMRNSIQSLAQLLYSHKELDDKNGSELQEMCFQRGENWNNLPVGQKRGRIITYNGKWEIFDSFDFVKDRELFEPVIPYYET